MHKTSITPHGEASWKRLPSAVQETVLSAIEAPITAPQVQSMRDRPDVFSLRVGDLRVIFTERDSVRTIITVLTRSESDALGIK